MTRGCWPLYYSTCKESRSTCAAHVQTDNDCTTLQTWPEVTHRFVYTNESPDKVLVVSTHISVTMVRPMIIRNAIIPNYDLSCASGKQWNLPFKGKTNQEYTFQVHHFYQVQQCPGFTVLLLTVCICRIILLVGIPPSFPLILIIKN